MVKTSIWKSSWIPVLFLVAVIVFVWSYRFVKEKRDILWEPKETFLNRKKVDSTSASKKEEDPTASMEEWILIPISKEKNEKKWWIGWTEKNKVHQRKKVHACGSITLEKNGSQSYRNWKWFIEWWNIRDRYQGSDHQDPFERKDGLNENVEIVEKQYMVLFDTEKDRFQWYEKEGNGLVALEVMEGNRGRVIPIVAPFFESIHVEEREDGQMSIYWKGDEIGETMSMETSIQNIWDAHETKLSPYPKDEKHIQRWLFTPHSLDICENVPMYAIEMGLLLSSLQ